MTLKPNLLAVLLAASFGFVTSNVHALPRVGVDLVRVSGEGIQPLPGIADSVEPPRSMDALVAQGELAEEADSPRMDSTGKYQIVTSSAKSFSIRFRSSLPEFNDPIYLVRADGGSIVGTFYPNAPNVRFNPDRTKITLSLDSPLSQDQRYVALFPGTVSFPPRIDPCGIIVQDVVVAEPTPTPSPRGIPTYAYVVAAGVLTTVIILLTTGRRDRGSNNDDGNRSRGSTPSN